MRLLFRVKISKPADGIWKFLVTAEYFQQWNDKIESIDCRGEFRSGESFATRYQWRGKITQCMTTVTALVPLRLLELHHSDFVGLDVKNDMDVVERISLSGRAGWTMVTRQLRIKNHGVPIILIPVLWFVSRFGRPTEPDPLKVMCERGS